MRGYLTDYDCIRGCQTLEPRRNVRRLPQGELLLPPAAADLADDYQPGVDAEPHGQAHPVRRSRRVFNVPMASTIPSPQRTARWTSSSCAWG